MDTQKTQAPGLIVLFGSGETSPSGRKAYEAVLQRQPPAPQVAILETPAGFELNSDRVAGRVGEFLTRSLQNYDPQVEIVPARRRGTPFSPDEPEIVAPLYQADLIFMGPGSPTYAVRQLQGSRAWQAMTARHRLGAALVFASAAAIAVSAYTLPVYEIYKAGLDLHWQAGLNLFASFGLPLVFIPHWNNNDGGEELDTGRCFMGRERFRQLMGMLPPGLTVVGIDELTALVVDLAAGTCRALGQGGITLVHTGEVHTGALSDQDLKASGLDEVARLRGGHVHRFESGENFDLHKLGELRLPRGGVGLPDEVWARAQEAMRAREAAEAAANRAPEQVLELVAQRQAARAAKNWARADELRDAITALGWGVRDTPDGPVVERSG